MIKLKKLFASIVLSLVLLFTITACAPTTGTSTGGSSTGSSIGGDGDTSGDIFKAPTFTTEGSSGSITLPVLTLENYDYAEEGTTGSFTLKSNPDVVFSMEVGDKVLNIDGTAYSVMKASLQNLDVFSGSYADGKYAFNLNGNLTVDAISNITHLTVSGNGTLTVNSNIDFTANGSFVVNSGVTVNINAANSGVVLKVKNITINAGATVNAESTYASSECISIAKSLTIGGTLKATYKNDSNAQIKIEGIKFVLTGCVCTLEETANIVVTNYRYGFTAWNNRASVTVYMPAGFTEVNKIPTSADGNTKLFTFNNSAGVYESPAVAFDTGTGDNSSASIISFIGDSITNGAGVSLADRYTNLIDADERYLARNYGINGTTIADTSHSSFAHNSFTKRYTEIDTDSDVIFVFGGTNDYGSSAGQGVTLGTIEDTTISTFYGALDVLINGLKTNYPDAKLCFITPIERHNSAWGYPSGETNEFGYTLQDYRDAIIYKCNQYGIDCLDMSNVDFPDEYFSDGLHPTATGHEFLADYIFNYLENNV